MKGIVDAARRAAAKFLDTFFGSYICSKFFKAIIQIFQQALLFKVGLGPDVIFIIIIFHYNILVSIFIIIIIITIIIFIIIFIIIISSLS